MKETLAIIQDIYHQFDKVYIPIQDGEDKFFYETRMTIKAEWIIRNHIRDTLGFPKDRDVPSAIYFFSKNYGVSLFRSVRDKLGTPPGMVRSLNRIIDKKDTLIIPPKIKCHICGKYKNPSEIINLCCLPCYSPDGEIKFPINVCCFKP